MLGNGPNRRCPSHEENIQRERRNRKTRQGHRQESFRKRRHRPEQLAMQRRRRKRSSFASERTTLSIRNFRPVAGFPHSRVYRCGSTDVLGARVRKARTANANRSSTPKWSDDDHNSLVARDAGLVMDLRSAPERNESDALLWIHHGRYQHRGKGEPSTGNQGGVGGHRPMRLVTIQVENPREAAAIAHNLFRDEENAANSRTVIRLDLLNRAELLSYARQQWLSPLSPETSGDDAHELVIAELNQRGLAGLNEAILETPSGQTGLCLALQLMTLYREALVRASASGIRRCGIRHGKGGQSSGGAEPSNSSIVFHCVQGKDRTGMLAMLMQLLVGCSETVLLEDYHRSNKVFANKRSSPLRMNDDEAVSLSSAAAAALTTNDTSHGDATNRHRRQRPRMDASVFRGTTRRAMVATLQGLRSRHGTNLEGYFETIGFDAEWRTRFVAVFGFATVQERGAVVAFECDNPEGKASLPSSRL